MQEVMSRMLAVRLGSISSRSPRSLTIPPVVSMAMVLFAVQPFASPTRAAKESSPDRFPDTRRVSRSTMKSIPPRCRISSRSPPASSVTMIRSLMPEIPSPAFAITSTGAIVPVPSPTSTERRMPAVRETRTLTPLTASRITAR